MVIQNNYDTLLGVLFRGALARAFLRQAAGVVRDEPTSLMDSWAEADWMRHLHELVQGKTVILITHRFTTARHADIIHVLRAAPWSKTAAI